MRYPKPTTWRSKKLMEACRTIPCVSCGAQDGTVVAAHANFGKGIGIKSSDATVMALCFRCHTGLDQSGDMNKLTRRDTEYEYNAKTLRALLENGTLKVTA